jgi:hypothetical protein
MSLQSIERQVFIQQGQINVIQYRIDDIQTDIAGLPALTTQVATNTSNITTLQGQVSTLNGEVAGLPALTTQVATNTSNITKLQEAVDKNTSNIATNTTNIATNTTNIATNTTNIATNTTNIATNTTNIATNTTNIATNTSNISSLNTKLQAVSTSVGQQTTKVKYSVVGSPSSYVPDQSPPIANIVDMKGWRFTKPTGINATKINWYMFSPYYGLTPPLVAPVPAILKSSLTSVWAVITTTNPITTQGYLYFNIYTYDYLNPPLLPLSGSGAPPFYSNRWSYNMCPNGLPTTTAIPTLCEGYKYLLYCWDAPKLVSTPAISSTITMANGQFPSQTASQKLRDPLDIYTDLVHVPLGAVNFNTTNTPQPANPLNVYVSGISIETPTSNVNPALDFTIEAFGYNDQRFVLTY